LFHSGWQVDRIKHQHEAAKMPELLELEESAGQL